MTLTRLFESDLLMMAMLALPLLTMAAVVASTWIIGEHQSGLVIKKFGAPLPARAADRARRRGGLPGPAAVARLALRPVGAGSTGWSRCR